MIAIWTPRIIVAVGLAVIAGLIMSISSAIPNSEAATRDDGANRACAVRRPACTHEVFYGIPVQDLYVLMPEDLLS
jgi:hypothetical protein